MDVSHFLFLSCVVLCTVAQAQDCSRPILGPNMDLKGNDILRESFPDSSRARLSCSVGYLAVGGSLFIVCKAGRWSRATLKCERKSCGALEELLNGDIKYTGSEFGDSATYVCNIGYRLIGRHTCHCGDQGWDCRVPRCEVVTCDPPPAIANGTYYEEKDIYNYREGIEYSCDSGLTLIGSTTSSCSDDGQFNPSAPQCKKVECPDFEIENGVWSGGSRPPHGFQATLTFSCNLGYKIKGHASVTCGSDNNWSPEPPVCEDVTCDRPSEVDHGSFSPDQDIYKYIDVIEYSCDADHEMTGIASRSCSLSGTFTAAPPICTTLGCSKPVPGANINFNSEDLLKDSFPDGSRVGCDCKTGYRAAGGNPFITCAAGAWSRVTLRCEGKFCGSLGKLLNGDVKYPGGKQFGDIARFVCNIGYRLVGKSTCHCGDQGWDCRMPECEVVSCDPPPVGVGVTYNPKKDVYGVLERIEYSCDKGLTLIGSRSSFCSDYGKFLPTSPQCKDVTCDRPSRVDHGSFSPDQDIYKYNDVIYYSCDDGYEMTGSASRSCSQSGTFTPAPPRCTTLECSKPDRGANMDLRDEDLLKYSFPDGTKVAFDCNTGYRAVGGSPSIVCKAGRWSRVTLRCEVKSCGSAGELLNGDIQYPDGKQIGDRAKFVCDTGYILVGRATCHCEDQGWDCRVPHCEVVTCDPPPAIVNGSYYPAEEVYEYREVVEYSCDGGLTLIGSTTRSCSEDGQFNPSAPQCKKVECPDIEIENGVWAGGSRPPHGYNATITFKCNPGYKMKGQATITCGSDNEWSPDIPLCEVSSILETCDRPSEVAHGSFSPDKIIYQLNEEVTYSCDEGYTLSGSASVSCSQSGFFAPAPPTCSEVECPDIEIENGVWAEGSRPPHGYNATIAFKCNPGYKMKGQATITCGSDNEWIQEPPVCEAVMKATH